MMRKKPVFTRAREPVFIGSTPDKIAKVVLYWSSEKFEYNLYRKTGNQAPVRINGDTPIRSAKNREELESRLNSSVDFNSFMAQVAKLAEDKKSVETLVKDNGQPPLVSKRPKRTDSLGQVDPGALKRSLNIFSAEEEVIFDANALFNLNFRLARGLAFEDSNVKYGEEYFYDLRGVNTDGSEEVLVDNVRVRAGHPDLPAAPKSIRVIPGDHQVLILWERNNDNVAPAYSYDVNRETALLEGESVNINIKNIIYEISKDLDNNPLDPDHPDEGTPGFLDYMTWINGVDPPDCLVPDPHPAWYYDTHGNRLETTTLGPKNGVPYTYRVHSVDILGQAGPWSEPHEATPVDRTPPKAPLHLSVEHYDIKDPNKFRLKWDVVQSDADGHKDEDYAQNKYMIYKAKNYTDYENFQKRLTAVVQKPGNIDKSKLFEDSKSKLSEDSTIYKSSTKLFKDQLTADDYQVEDKIITYDDSNPLESWKDEHTLDGKIVYNIDVNVWYWVCCEDQLGNLSVPSAAIQTKILDRIPPGPTNITFSEGEEYLIRIKWKKNLALDLAGYQIWRSICNRGKPYAIDPTNHNEPSCNFTMIGEVLAKTTDTNDVVYTKEDKSIPKESPLCYAYWVRAFDKNRNLYVPEPNKFGSDCPDSGEYACQKLHEKTPPEVPIITGLKAQNNSVLVSWVSSPIQDLAAFHIYRSEKENDPQPEWVGYVTKSPQGGDTWTGETESMPFEEKLDYKGCADVPAEPYPKTVWGELLDTYRIEPNKEYWYRVSAIDWLGNESKPEIEGSKQVVNIPAISTFTYSLDKPDPPTVLPCQANASGECGLTIRWEPQNDSANVIGYVVFRATAEAGVYRQVSPIIKGNEFTDKSAIKSTKYLYKVQALGERGKFSDPSQPVPYEY